MKIAKTIKQSSGDRVEK